MAALERQDIALPAPPVSADAIPLSLRRRGATARQVLAMAAVGAVVLALFASPDLPGWADRLGDGPVARSVQPIAQGWDWAMTRLGLTRPHQAVRDAVQRMQEWQW